MERRWEAQADSPDPRVAKSQAILELISFRGPRGRKWRDRIDSIHLRARRRRVEATDSTIKRYGSMPYSLISDRLRLFIRQSSSSTISLLKADRIDSRRPKRPIRPGSAPTAAA